jgi:hypothetical protein
MTLFGDMVAYWSCATLPVRGDLPTVLECAKHEHCRMGDASLLKAALFTGLAVPWRSDTNSAQEGLSAYCPLP